MIRRARLPLGAAVAALMLLTGASAAEAFDAHGSARQVYVTGLAAKQEMALVDSSGRTVQRKRASGLGGLLFRDVEPGGGYRVRPAGGGAASGPLTVLSNRPAPPSTAVYGQALPANGYGYLTTRDGTRLAVNVHPPEDIANAAPTGDLGQAVQDLIGRLPQMHFPPVARSAQVTPVPGVTAHPTLIEYSGY